MIDPDNALDQSDDERAYAELTKDSALADQRPEPEATPEPAKPAAAKEPEAKDAKPAEPVKDAEPFPGYGALPEDVRKAFDTERAERQRFERESRENFNKYRAVQGQNVPIQRQNEELRRQTAALEAKAKEQAARLEKWEAYKTEYPAEAQAVEEMLGPVRSQIDDARKENAQLAERLQEQHQRQVIREQMTELTKLQPEWESKVFGANKGHQRDPERIVEYFDPQFGAWFFAQHPNVQTLFGSDAAADNAYLLELYDRDIALANLHQQAQGNPTPAPDPVLERRERALSNTAPGIRSTQSGTRNAAALDDEEAAFAALTAGNPNFV